MSIRWVRSSGMWLYIVEIYISWTNTGAAKEIQHLIRAEEAVITQHGIDDSMATKSHML